MESACGRRKCEDLDNDARSVFFLFKIWANFKAIFFCVSQNFRYIFGSDKFPAISISNDCITNLNPLNKLNEEHTELKNVKSW